MHDLRSHIHSSPTVPSDEEDVLDALATVRALYYHKIHLANHAEVEE